MRTLALASSSLVLSLLAAPLATAQDEDSAYCRRVRAQAESQAFLLLSPRIGVQGLHVPLVGGTTGAGVVQGQEWQARAALSFSPLDMARGAMVLDAAGAECRRHERRAVLGRTLDLGGAYGRLDARRAQIAYLEGQREAVAAIVADAERARAEQILTMHELNTVRLRANAFERNLASLRADVERLEGDEEEEASGEQPVRAQLAEYEALAMDVEGAQSSIRRLSPWSLSVTAGVVPLDPFDWYGAVSLSYNLGGIAQAFAEDAYLEAREEELRQTSGEMRRRVERFERRMRESTEELRDALTLLDAQAELLEEQRELLERTGAETAMAQQSLRLVRMNRIELEGERIYQRQLLSARESVAPTGEDDER